VSGKVNRPKKAVVIRSRPIALLTAVPAIPLIVAAWGSDDNGSGKARRSDGTTQVTYNGGRR
jgi:hypothetical protein